MIDVVVYTSPNHIELQKTRLGECRPDDVIVKTIYTMVSSGTELRVLSGCANKPEDYPCIPGYVVIGKIVELGTNVKGWRTGDMVSCRNPEPVPDMKQIYGGQASYHRYSTLSDIRPIALPGDARPLDYVCAEVASISLRGITLANVSPDESAIVIGQGLIGALSAAWLVRSGCRVVTVDRVDERLKRSRKLGVAATVAASDPDAVFPFPFRQPARHGRGRLQ